MSLRHAYTIWAPAYDLIVDRATRGPRRRSLASLGEVIGRDILLSGVGSGLDIPWLPAGGTYHGIDLTPAMLARARRRAVISGLDILLSEGDAMALPFRDASFHVVVLHLILAVVPDPAKALTEAVRVARPGARLLILDKFLSAGQRAPLRRLLSPVIGRLATRTDVEREALFAGQPDLQVIEDAPALAGGWFRRIVAEKRAM